MKRRLLFALIAAVLLAGLSFYAVPDAADNTVSDLLYQHAGTPGADIAVIGIDQASLNVLGPLPWPRSRMAQAIENLNADPQSRPAVIGIDVLYTEEGADSESNRLLADAAAQYGNVVFASYFSFSDALADSGSGFFTAGTDLQYFGPFPALAEVSSTGHINAQEDTDGILRHAFLSLTSSDGTSVPSFARVLYEKYCSATAQNPNPSPSVSARQMFYLPFSAKAGAYCDGYNFLDLYYGDIPADYLRDKIILIGPYAVGLDDAYPTSLDHADPMYGIDIHANTVNAFQKGFFPREIKPVPQLVLLFVLLFLSALFFWKRRAVSSLLCWLALSAGWVGFCCLACSLGYIFHVLWLPLSLSVLFLFSLVWNYAHTRREKQLIDETFGRYIDPSVKKTLLQQGISSLQLGGRTMDIAVLFVDIRGFTSMSEALDAQTVVEILNRYLTLATDCIVSNRGTLDKFVGDCAMAVWNAPVEITEEDPVILACRAALDMVKKSDALSAELLARYGRTVSFGIGINWGPAVVGNIGAPLRMDYTAIGDTVNTAARLEANAPGGEIYISRSVADRLGEDRAEFESLGTSVRLKGKSGGFEVLRLLSLKNT